MKKILITGGTGFIGSNLCHELLQISKLNHIICLDNLSCSSKKNIYPLLESSRFEFIRHDVCDSFDIECDEIYHLACPASTLNYYKNPVKTIKTCFNGTLNALECARNNNAKIVITSTSEVYGDPLEHPQKENYFGNVNPIGTRSCYNEGKRAAESLAFNWAQQNKTKIRIARLFNTYGPRMLENDGRVIPNFITQARDGKKITVHGDGLQTRSFCYIEDTINALRKLMNVNIDDPFSIVNIGNPEEKSILQVAQIIASIYNTEIDFIPPVEDDPKKRKPNIDEAIKLLNWEPYISFDKGIQRTIIYFDDLVRFKR